MSRQHHYKIETTWTGNKGKGTNGYTSYERNHIIKAPGKILLECSAEPAFRGDASKYNPEELFVASISSCHMLWYLHLCSDNKITVVEYKDEALGTMQENHAGGKFTEVVLHPQVSIMEIEKKALAISLHESAHAFCFIANSCNFPITCKPEITEAARKL